MRRLLLLPLLLLVARCGDDTAPRSNARQVTERGDLVGGVRALGDMGDYVLENDEVRIVIQGPGFSRGFGIYGGSLIDADLRRPRGAATASRAEGNDTFGELFPAFFVQAMAVDSVEILDDGSDGGAARIAASGGAGDFLELAGLLNRIALGSHRVAGNPRSTQRLRYRTIYALEPGAKHVDLTFEVENVSSETLAFPSDLADVLLEQIGVDLGDFEVPVGDIALFGNASDVFLPGQGFDVRLALDAAYGLPVDFPSLPGIVTDFVASRSDLGASYGILAAESENNYVYQRRDTYGMFWPNISRTSMLVPFTASGFMGVFYETAPESLEPGEVAQVRKHFVVGNGDVGSVLDEMHRIRGVATGRVAGQVFERQTGAPLEGADVFVYQREGVRRVLSQYATRAGGSFRGDLEPGEYSARAFREGSPVSDFVDFAIRAGETSSLRLLVDAPGRIAVHVYDEGGAPIPAKATALGTYGPEHAGADLRTFLFDLSVGERWRAGDLVPDTDDPETRRYVEHVAFTDFQGAAAMEVRPGTYEVVLSRGPEWSLQRETVSVAAGQTVSVAGALRRVVETEGWIAADLHVHTRNSIDVRTAIEDRLRQLAAEGVELAVATDHNYVTDFEPFLARLGLEEHLRGVVGLELSTLESGHFNGYPLRFQPGPITKGAFEWSERPPAEIFAELRSLGSLGADRTIVQVNHPREPITGYFNQYYRSALDTEEEPLDELEALIRGATGGGSLRPSGPAFRDGRLSTFTYEYDALEVLNGKLLWQVHHYRAPEEGELPEGIEAGQVLVDEDGEDEFPGVVDDWYNLLNLGHRYTAVGTSDTHSTTEEAGYFRSMLRVPDDRARAVDDADLSDAIRGHRVIATNGPMLEVWVEDPERGGIGSELVASGDVQVHLRLTAAPWVSVSRVNVVRDGRVVARLDVDPGRNLSADPLSETLTIAVDADCWIAAQAIGERSLFPVVRPLEIPPLTFADAIGTLAEPLGLGGEAAGGLGPALIYPITPYALTNPVWIRTEEGRSWEPPGVWSVEERDDPANDPGYDTDPLGFTRGPMRTSHPGRWDVQLPRVEARPNLFDRAPTDRADIRRLIRAFRHGHAH